MDKKKLVLAVLIAALLLGFGVATIAVISEPVSAWCCGSGPGSSCGNHICEPNLGENIVTCYIDCGPQ